MNLNHKAFSLLEMIIVLGIASVLTVTVVIPMMEKFSEGEVEAQFASEATDLRDSLAFYLSKPEVCLANFKDLAVNTTLLEAGNAFTSQVTQLQNTNVASGVAPIDLAKKDQVVRGALKVSELALKNFIFTTTSKNEMTADLSIVFKTNKRTIYRKIPMVFQLIPKLDASALPVSNLLSVAICGVAGARSIAGSGGGSDGLPNCEAGESLIRLFDQWGCTSNPKASTAILDIIPDELGCNKQEPLKTEAVLWDKKSQNGWGACGAKKMGCLQAFTKDGKEVECAKPMTSGSTICSPEIYQATLNGRTDDFSAFENDAVCASQGGGLFLEKSNTYHGPLDLPDGEVRENIMRYTCLARACKYKFVGTGVQNNYNSSGPIGGHATQACAEHGMSCVDIVARGSTCTRDNYNEGRYNMAPRKVLAVCDPATKAATQPNVDGFTACGKFNMGCEKRVAGSAAGCLKVGDYRQGQAGSIAVSQCSSQNFKIKCNGSASCSQACTLNGGVCVGAVELFNNVEFNCSDIIPAASPYGLETPRYANCKK